MKILLLDDHCMIRKGLQLLLSHSYPSAQIVEESDTSKMQQLILEGNYDVVISDLMMPGEPVVEIIKNVRNEGNKTPIIVLSMSPTEKNAVRIIRSGASAYITKDNAPSDLIKAIQFVMGGRKYITPDVAELLADAYSGNMDKQCHENLSDREFEVLKMVAKGNTMSSIASKLAISINTVSTYKTRILEKMNMQNKADIIKYAHSNALV